MFSLFLQHKEFSRSRIFLAVCLLAVVTLSLCLRLYRLDERYHWYGDTARDALVSKHIWRYGEHLSVGHYASGLQASSDVCQVRNYPSYYYYLMALIWSLGRSVYGVSVILVVLNSLSILCVYGIVSQLVDRKAGLIAALLYSVTFPFITTSQFATTVVVPIPFLLAAVAGWTWGRVHQKMLMRTASLLLLLYLSTFHYSILLFFVFFFVLEYVEQLQKDGSKGLFRIFVYGFGYVLIFCFLHAAVIQQCGGVLPFIKMFIPISSAQQRDIIQQITFLVTSHGQALFRQGTLFCVGFAAAAGMYAVRFSERARWQLGAVCGLIILFTVGGGLLPSSNAELQLVQTHYLRLVMFFAVVLAIGHALHIAIKHKSYLLVTVLAVQIALTMLSLSISFAVFVPFHYPRQEVELAEYLSGQTELQPFTVTLQKENEGDYDTAVLAFWLEEFSGQKMYESVDGSESRTNYLSAIRDPRYKLFICDTQRNWKDINCELGLQNFADQSQLYVAKPTPLTYKQYIVRIFEREGQNEK